jgi:hypothetical protein
MVRGTKLLFAPGANPAADKRSHAQECAFLWDASGNRGFMLNDPMQAYAPMSSSLQFTNVAAGPAVNNATPETISGHRCQQSEVTVTANDGTATSFRVWRATDLKGLAVRITGTSSGSPLTLTLSKVRLEHLPGDLFLPPSSFTKYDSAEALMTELVARQMNYKRRPTYQAPESEPSEGSNTKQPNRPN